MLVREDNYAEIKHFLHNQRWNNGYEYVAYLDDGFPLDKYLLTCFSTEEEALEYCYENTTDLDTFKFMGIRSAYRAMTEGQKMWRNGAIDVRAMVNAYHDKLKNEQLTENKKGVKMETQVFNEDNYNYLNNQLESMGFTNYPQRELIKKMKSSRPEFSIKQSFDFSTHSGPNTGKANATLQFSQSAETGMYFFNRYDMSVLRSNERDVATQTFYTNNRITVKEAYNLMNGRSVFKKIKNKEGQEKEVWLQLDFKNTDKNGNFLLSRYGKEYFDLGTQLDKYAFKGSEYVQSKAEFSNQLKKGNRQKATLVYPNGKEKICFVQANPAARSLVFFDENQRRLRPEEIPMTPQNTEAQVNEQVQDVRQVSEVSVENPEQDAQKMHNEPVAGEPEKEQLDEGKHHAEQTSESLSGEKDAGETQSLDKAVGGVAEAEKQFEDGKVDVNIFAKKLSKGAEKTDYKAEKAEEQKAGAKRQRPTRGKRMSA